MLSDLGRVSFIAGKASSYVQNVSVEAINYAHDLWPLQLRGGCTDHDECRPIQSRAGYEQVSRQI